MTIDRDDLNIKRTDDENQILTPSTLLNNKTGIEKRNNLNNENIDNTSLILLSISGGLMLVLVLILLVKKYRNKFSVAPCPPIVVISSKKENYVKRNNNKPRDYILEILPGTPRSALFNRVPVAKKVNKPRRSRSLPRKSSKSLGLKRRVNSLPDLNKLDIEKNRRKNKLPPLPIEDEPPQVPVRNERIKRLVNIKKRMREQKERASKLLPI